MMIEISGPVAGALIAFGGVVFGLLLSRQRVERQRRRELHAGALATVLAYGEMPFAIRRRRCESEHASAERVRLSEHFYAVKAEISTCQVLIGADGHERLSAAYNDVVETARATAGTAAHNAWREPAVADDSETNMAALHQQLQPFRERLREFELGLASATLPLHKRLWRWYHSVDVETRRRRVRELPHDLPDASSGTGYVAVRREVLGMESMCGWEPDRLDPVRTLVRYLDQESPHQLDRRMAAVATRRAIWSAEMTPERRRHEAPIVRVIFVRFTLSKSATCHVSTPSSTA